MSALNSPGAFNKVSANKSVVNITRASFLWASEIVFSKFVIFPSEPGY